MKKMTVRKKRRAKVNIISDIVKKCIILDSGLVTRFFYFCYYLDEICYTLSL